MMTFRWPYCFCICFLLLFLASGNLLGQSALSEAPLLIPQPLYVGDRGRLILRPEVSASTDVPLVIDMADKLPQNEHVHVYRIELEIRPEGPLILIDFSVYIPGEVPFPEIEIGAYRIRPPAIHVDSVLEDTNALLSAPTEALSAPGTRLLLYGLVVLFLILVLGSFLFIHRILPWIKRLMAEIVSHRAFRSLKKSLQKLDCTSNDSAAVREFLEQLNTVLRVYLNRRFGAAFLSLTAAEINGSTLRTLSPEGAASFSKLFSRMDALRFSTLKTDVHELCELAATALSLAETLEQTLAEKARAPEKEARF